MTPACLQRGMATKLLDSWGSLDVTLGTGK